jgi:hypothetical protein
MYENILATAIGLRRRKLRELELSRHPAYWALTVPYERQRPESVVEVEPA